MSIRLENVEVQIENKVVLNDINFEINKGDIVWILGPNGHGKSTLLKSIMKHYTTNITKGSIYIDNEKVNDFSTDMIAKKGIYLAMQYPVEIPGLGMLELLRNEASKNEDERINIIDLYKTINQKMKDLNMNPELLNRNINENFSGGERKKNEILQMKVLDPQYILLDEIDSGLDVDSINIIGNALVEEKDKGKTIICISHDEKLLNILKPNKTILIMNGQIVDIGDQELASHIYKTGYFKYAKEKNIALENNDNLEFLKNTNKGFNCGGK